MVEQEAVNFEVAGSSPAVGAKSIYFTGYPVSIHATGFPFLLSVISTLDMRVLIFYIVYRSFYASLETINTNDERRFI